MRVDFGKQSIVGVNDLGINLSILYFFYGKLKRLKRTFKRNFFNIKHDDFEYDLGLKLLSDFYRSKN